MRSSAPRIPSRAAPAPASEAPAVMQNVFRIEFSCEGVNARVMENLLADLAGRGALENLSLPVAGAGRKTKKQTGKKAGKQILHHCALRLATQSSEEDIWEALAFVVDPANLKIEVEASPSTNAGALPSADSDKPNPHDVQPDRGYGFFPEAPTAPAAAAVAEH